MLEVLQPIVPIGLGQGGAAQYQQVLGVAGLGGVGEIKAARHHHLAVQDHDLIVRDGMRPIQSNGDACRVQQADHVPVGGVAFFIQQDLHLRPPLVGANQRLGNGVVREAIGLSLLLLTAACVPGRRQEALLVRVRQPFDNATPGGNSLHAANLLRDEISRNMAMLGINSMKEMTRDLLVPARGPIS